jgi:hypothetical protein
VAQTIDERGRVVTWRPTQDEYEQLTAHDYGEHGDGLELWCNTHQAWESQASSRLVAGRESTEGVTRNAPSNCGGGVLPFAPATDTPLAVVREEVAALLSVILSERIAFTRHNVCTALNGIVSLIDRELAS